MKKLFFAIAMLTMTLAANAQFEQGKTFVGASLSGLDMNYSGADNFKLNVDAKAGMFFTDNWLGYGIFGYGRNGAAKTNHWDLGIGGRYYIVQNGLFLGLQGKYVYNTPKFNDFRPAVELGYAFFVGREMTIEPSVYYEQSFKNHKEYSSVGFKIGIGLYLNKNKIQNSVKEAFIDK